MKIKILCILLGNVWKKQSVNGADKNAQGVGSDADGISSYIVVAVGLSSEGGGTGEGVDAAAGCMCR